MPYHTPFPSFPLHVQNQSVPVNQQSLPTDNDPARQNNPTMAMPLVGGMMGPRSMHQGAGGGSQMGAFPDTLAAVTMQQRGGSMMGMSPPTIYPSMMVSVPPMTHQHMHNGGARPMMGSPPPMSNHQGHQGGGRSMMGMSPQTIYPSMMGSPAPLSHHQTAQQFSSPPFPASRSPMQQYSMIVLPNRTIHQTYGTVLPQNQTNQVYNDLPMDARTMQAEMMYDPTMPHQEAPGQLKTVNELANQNAGNQSYAYGMQQYGPVSQASSHSYGSTNRPTLKLIPTLQFPYRPEGCEQLNKLNTYVSLIDLCLLAVYRLNETLSRIDRAVAFPMACTNLCYKACSTCIDVLLPVYP
jgi:hypothetical protein